MTLWNCNSNDNIKNSNNSNDIHWDKISLLALMLYCYKVLSWVLKVFKLSLKSFLHFHIHLSVKAETTNIEVYQLSSTLKSDLCGVSCAECSENLQPVSRTLKALWQVQTSAAARSEEKKKQQPERPDPGIITAAAPGWEHSGWAYGRHARQR